MRSGEFSERLCDILVTIGKNIKSKRGAMSMSRAELVRLCGISKSSMEAYEKGKQNLSLEAIIRIADALKMHPAELLLEAKEEDKQGAIEELCRRIIQEELKKILKN